MTHTPPPSPVELDAFKKTFGIDSLDATQQVAVTASCLNTFLQGYRAQTETKLYDIDQLRSHADDFARSRSATIFENFQILAAQWEAEAQLQTISPNDSPHHRTRGAVETQRNDALALRRLIGTMRRRQKLETFQERATKWLFDCFGDDIARDRQQRCWRMCEEALETVQAADMTREEAHQLVDYVYNRPKGELKQEVGGLMTTVAAFCFAHNVDMMECGHAELERVSTPVIMEKIREKQKNKPKFGPLPGHNGPTTAHVSSAEGPRESAAPQEGKTVGKVHWIKAHAVEKIMTANFPHYAYDDPKREEFMKQIKNSSVLMPANIAEREKNGFTFSQDWFDWRAALIKLKGSSDQSVMEIERDLAKALRATGEVGERAISALASFFGQAMDKTQPQADAVARVSFFMETWHKMHTNENDTVIVADMAPPPQHVQFLLASDIDEILSILKKVENDQAN